MKVNHYQRCTVCTLLLAACSAMLPISVLADTVKQMWTLVKDTSEFPYWEDLISVEKRVAIVAADAPYAITTEKNQTDLELYLGGRVDISSDGDTIYNVPENAQFLLKSTHTYYGFRVPGTIATDLVITNDYYLNYDYSVNHGWDIKYLDDKGTCNIIATKSSGDRFGYYPYLWFKAAKNSFSCNNQSTGLTMRIYMLRDVIVPDDTVPEEPELPVAPSVDMGDEGLLFDGQTIDLDGREAVTLTLNSDEGYDIYYRFTESGDLTEDEDELLTTYSDENAAETDDDLTGFIRYESPVIIGRGGLFEYYTEASDGLRSPIQAITFTGISITTKLSIVEDMGEENPRYYDLQGRPVAPSFRGVCVRISKNGATIIR